MTSDRAIDYEARQELAELEREFAARVAADAPLGDLARTVIVRAFLTAGNEKDEGFERRVRALNDSMRIYRARHAKGRACRDLLKGVLRGWLVTRRPGRPSRKREEEEIAYAASQLAELETPLPADLQGWLRASMHAKYRHYPLERPHAGARLPAKVITPGEFVEWLERGARSMPLPADRIAATQIALHGVESPASSARILRQLIQRGHRGMTDARLRNLIEWRYLTEPRMQGRRLLTALGVSENTERARRQKAIQACYEAAFLPG